MSQTMIRYPVKRWVSEQTAKDLLISHTHVFLGRQGDKILLGYWNVKENATQDEMQADENEREIIERELP